MRRIASRPGAAVLLAALLAIGCSQAPETTLTPPGGSVAPGASPIAPDQAAVTRYGYAPVRNAAVTYQPDVVLLEDGAAAIRGVSGNTLTWTIDRRARGAADLAVGKVMFATSKAVGRIVTVHDEADTRVVTLAPVDLTEVIRDGEISISQPIDLDDFVLEAIPDLPGALAQPRADDPTPLPIGRAGAGAGMLTILRPTGATQVAIPALRLVPRNAGPGGAVPPLAALAGLDPTPEPSPSGSPPPSEPPRTHCLEVELGAWIAKPCAEGKQISLEINHQQGEGGLKLGAVVAIKTDNLRLDSRAPIVGGVMNEGFAALAGITGVEISITGGIADAADNAKVRMEVPVEVDFPIPPGATGIPIPMNLKIETEFVVETAMSGRNSVLAANADYSLAGEIGWKGGEFLKPNYGVEKSILDTIGGLTIGPSGIVVATKTKVQAGIGVPAATAGPYVALTVSIGISQGSSLGASLARCRGATLSLTGTTGLGLSLETEPLEAITKLLGEGRNIKLKTEVEKTWNLIDPITQVVPDVPLCRAS